MDDINATIRDIEARLARGTKSPPEHSTPGQSKQGTPRLSMDSGFATLRHDKAHLRADDLGATVSSQKEPSGRRKSVQFGPRDQTEPDEHMYDLSKYLHKDVKRSDDGSDQPHIKGIDKMSQCAQIEDRAKMSKMSQTEPRLNQAHPRNWLIR